MKKVDKLKIFENYIMKHGRSKNYNFNFNKKDGYFERWGKTTATEDDPDYSPFGPEILDLEISSSVRPEDKHLYDESRLVNDGGCLGSCDFCYKSNGKFPTYNMNLDEFKTIISKMPKSLTQIAFGILNYRSNPDFIAMAKYSRSKGIIPNFTMHGLDNITEIEAKEISELFGACAVSCYNKNATYKTIKKLTDNGMDQVNIHYMISKETYDEAFNIIDDMKMDDRLSKMNAIVFLSLKQKGKGKDFHPVSESQYKNLVNYALNMDVRFGFDSCSAHKFLNAVKDHEKYKQFEMMAEPCESNIFSHYCNCKGESFPCSFAENHEMFPKGLDTLNCNNFLDDIWNAKESILFKDKLLKNNRNCPLYTI